MKYSARLIFLALILFHSACDNPLGNLSSDSTHFPDSSSSLPTAPVSSGLVAWYGARFISGKSNGDTVSEWVDQSGNSNDATAPVLPTYVSSGINSQPSLLFGTGSALTRFVTPSLTMTERTFVIVFEILGTPPFSFGPLIAHPDVSGSGPDYFLAENAVFQIGHQGTNTNGSTAPSGIQIATVVIGSSAVVLRLDGAQEFSTALAASATTGALQIGGLSVSSDVTNGEIAEVMIFDRELTAAEITSVETFLNSIYAAF